PLWPLNFPPVGRQSDPIFGQRRHEHARAGNVEVWMFVCTAKGIDNGFGRRWSSRRGSRFQGLSSSSRRRTTRRSTRAIANAAAGFRRGLWESSSMQKPKGILTVSGTIDFGQFWPDGMSDADTTKILARVSGASFSFQKAPGAPTKTTNVFAGAFMKGPDSVDPKTGKKRKPKFAIN